MELGFTNAMRHAQVIVTRAAPPRDQGYGLFAPLAARNAKPQRPARQSDPHGGTISWNSLRGAQRLHRSASGLDIV